MRMFTCAHEGSGMHTGANLSSDSVPCLVTSLPCVETAPAKWPHSIHGGLEALPSFGAATQAQGCCGHNLSNSQRKRDAVLLRRTSV
jgi:hypothetical protein